MGFDFRFHLVESRPDTLRLIDFLRNQHLGYPNYQDWVQRTEAELDSRIKTAVLATSNGHPVGNIVWQPHKQLPRVREIKNLRVHPSLRRRFFASFLVKQAEVEDPEYDAIICDARSDQLDTIEFIRTLGYTPITSASLYDPNTQDTVMIKCFNRETESGIIYSSRELILSREL